MPDNFTYDVFISYRRTDQPIAERLEANLKALGLRVWRDDRLNEDVAAAAYPHKIQEAHEASAKVIVLWSRTATRSKWVLAEATLAEHRGKYIGILIEPTELVLPFNVDHALKIAAVEADPQLLTRALGAFEDKGRPGRWVLFEADTDLTKLPTTFASRLYGRDREMADLIQAWDGGQTRIFALDAIGGAGKTALVYHFVQALKASGWRGARRIYAWSFYSQGSNEDRQTGADEFFKGAYAFFSNGTEAPPRDPREKGVHLAHLVQRERALLILDGLEPLQYAAGSRGGRDDTARVGGIKDPGVKALLAILAEENEGLVVVTTRIELAELKGNASVVFEALDRLPLMDGIALIRDLGVVPEFPPATSKLPPASAFAALIPAWQPPGDKTGTGERGYVDPPAGDQASMPTATARQLIEAVEELKGHALALTLVGNYLRTHHHGDVRALHDLPSLAELTGQSTRSPYRVMRAIEIALGRRVADDDPDFQIPAETAAGRQLALLFFLGFFDRPIERELLPVVFAKLDAPLAPETADIALAGKDLVPILKALDPLQAEYKAGDLKDWRKIELERAMAPLVAERDAVYEARHRVLGRRLFADMAAFADNEGQITAALASLADQGLVARTSDKDAWKRAFIDCHPLVREYFGTRLKELDRPLYEAGHGRLYDHYRYAGLPAAFQDPVAYGLLALCAAYPEVKDHIAMVARQGQWPDGWKDVLPTTLLRASWDSVRAAATLIDGPEWTAAQTAFLPEDEKGMTPLFAAIGHGCAAGRQVESWSEVYWPRITRGNEDFASRTLGLYGQELAAVASFFDEPFSAPSANLPPARQALALSTTGFQLRALGRLEDAVAPMRRAVEIFEALNIAREVARESGNLSELLLTLGRLGGGDGAVAAGRQAITFADRSGDLFRGIVTRASNTAPSLIATGALAEAEALFRTAESVQQERQPDLPRLYSMQGFSYADLRLTRGSAAEAAERGDYALATVMQSSRTPLDIALAQLTRARATLALASLPGETNGASLTAAALAALRRANVEIYLPAGLLAHAAALAHARDTRGAEAHLREAEAIATRGPMPLYLAEAKLLRARMALACGQVNRARTHSDAAAELITAHGWNRALPELAILDAEIAAAEGAAHLPSLLDDAVTLIRGTPFHDKRTGITIDGGWWGLWPRLDALLPATHPARPLLDNARAAYNAERDTYLANETATLEKKLAAKWVEEDRALADPDFHRELSEALVANGYKPLDDTPLAEQRNDARNYLKMKRDAEGRRPSSSGADATAVIPDAAVRHIFTAPEAQELLRDFMRQNNLPGAPADLPFDFQRAIVAHLVQAGTITLESSPDPAAADPPPAPRKPAAAAAPPKPKRRWWPFGGNS